MLLIHDARPAARASLVRPLLFARAHAQPQRDPEMADTSVEPKGLERTAESVRRREEVLLPLPSSDRDSSGVSDLGSICVGQDGEATLGGATAVDGGPAQAPEAPAEGSRGQRASRSPPLPCTHRDPPTARAPKSPSTARAPLSRRVPTMPFPAPMCSSVRTHLERRWGAVLQQRRPTGPIELP